MRQTRREFGAIDISGLERHTVVLERRTLGATDRHFLDICADPNPYFVVFILALLYLLCTEVEREIRRNRRLEANQRTTLAVLVVDLGTALG